MSEVANKSDRAGGAGDDLFRTVTSNRMSEAIVDQIRTLIRSEKLRPGDRLPSERELGERMGVSRVTVREALRVLEAGGLIEIRVGARGGAFVTSPTTSQVGSGLADLITLSPVTASEVTEARQVVELGIIPIVVERATDEDIAELRAMVEEHAAALKKGQYGMPMSAAFHQRVAACTHNNAIEMLVHSFHGPLLMSLREAQVAAPLMGHRGTNEHRDFVEALAARDADRATEIMRTHLSRTARRVARVRAGQQRESAD
ncbi:GntR family transcriptional regulator [Phytohabitans sp. ZYX-F-186]|uniref:GntR family transcriptional regulator n=1 Tax=Phytohabitans maris TaxID=3071409 RepID=A0ABU0ZKN9_9ACTN|nr:FCD domain-containing protein [Phytohabitans sp. ZYX-F-186]MDQ7907553.1 GntR family transcriptional regulator [Phytohabitans sp. ZYX-F-186]